VKWARRTARAPPQFRTYMPSDGRRTHRGRGGRAYRRGRERLQAALTHEDDVFVRAHHADVPPACATDVVWLLPYGGPLGRAVCDIVECRTVPI
jgi:hypothetical protein